MPYDANKNELEILEFWKKDKTLPADVQMAVINYMFRKVTLQALHLADLLQLPPVVNLPKLSMGAAGTDLKKK